MSPSRIRVLSSSALVAAFLVTGATAQAQLLNFAPLPPPNSLFQQILPPAQEPMQIAPQDQAPVVQQEAIEQGGEGAAPELRRQIVSYRTKEAPGTIIVDTPNTYLYYVLGDGKAVRYGIGVGREGFTWSGVRSVGRKAEWPDWTPPPQMIDRQPYLPRWVAGGPGNPLGARALYLAGTMYRIHGTNDPSSIGKQVSSGCIRMLNADAIDLYRRVNVGTKVVVLPDGPRTTRTASR